MIRRIAVLLVLLLLFASPGFAALSAVTVWEARATGASDNNGGGFVVGSGGTDYSQQNAAQLTLTDLATTGVVTTLTSVTGGFTSAMVGNIIHIVSGTNFTAGFYQITAFTNGNTITLDRAPSTGVGSGGTGSVGGALATLGMLSGAMIASNKAYVVGAFTSTATNTFAQTVTPTSNAPPTRLIGYGSTRGDATHATLTLQTNTGLTAIKCTGAGFMVEQMDVDCASLGTSSGIQQGNFSTTRNCKIANFTTVGFTSSGTDAAILDCEVTGGTSAATSGGINWASSASVARRCFVHDNACPGIVVAAGNAVIRCIVANNSGASSDGIQTGSACLIVNNTIHNNGRDGIRATSNNMFPNEWQNNILTSNGGFGITGSNGTALPADSLYDGNAFFGNTSGARNLMDSTAGIFGSAPYTNVRDITLTGSPYVGPTTGTSANFMLNNTAGAGAALRGTGMPGTWPGNTGSTGYVDVGAVQHQDTGGVTKPPGIITAP